MKTKVPEFYEIKCDYRSCDLMASRYLPKVPFMVSLEGVIARDVKVCLKHKDKLIQRLEIEDSSKEIPYVKNGILRCSRCGHTWIPQLIDHRFIDSKEFMHLPERCSLCKSRTWRVKVAARNGRRKNIECLII